MKRALQYLNEISLSTIVVVGMSLVQLDRAAAQVIVPDGTLNTIVTQVGSTFTIDHGIASGNNLFHSFREFNLPTGNAAIFNNAATVQNIFSRVTGGNLSTIDGLIQTNGTANLFLLNPAGILFGPHTSLNIGGSFVGTTANSIQFADGNEFSATTVSDRPLLTMSAPIGLQMGHHSGEIVNRGHLAVGKDLTLAAGNLDLQGQLKAGRNLTLNAQNTVRIRDAASPFEARSQGNLTIQGQQNIDILALNHPIAAFQSNGNLRLISNGFISGDAHFVSGGSFSLTTVNGTPGQFISLFDPIIYANGDVIFGDYTGVALKVETTGSIQADNIVITGPDITVPNTDPDFGILTTQSAVILRAGVASVPGSNVPFSTGGSTFTNAATPIGGRSGSIIVNGIDTSNSVGSDGGSIILNAAGDITVNGDLRTYSTSPSSSSNAGSIRLSTSNGSITTNGYFYAFSSANSGSSGNGGQISLSTINGDITTNGRLDATSTADNGGTSGNGGQISLSATNGNITTNDILYLASISYSGKSSNGGNLSISTTNGNIIANNNFDVTSYSPDGTSGNGGQISLSATNGNITTQGLASYAVSFSGKSGNAGEISLLTTQGNIIGNGDIDATSFSGGALSGNGGQIVLSTGEGKITTNGFLSASSYAPNGTAGNSSKITISTANGHLEINRDLNAFSASNSSNGGNSGDGGGIALLAHNGDIIGANAVLNTFAVAPGGQAGKGGDVQLSAQNQISDLTVLTTSSSEQAGAVTLRGQSDLTLANLQLITSKQAQIQGPFGSLTIAVDGSGRSGDVMVASQGHLTLNNTVIQSETQGLDTAGNVNLTSPGQITLSNTQITSNTSNRGQAGNITLTAGSSIDLTNSSTLSALTSNVSKAGDITLNAPTINITGDTTISAATQGAGQGGTISLNAPTKVNLAQQGATPVLSVEASGAGQAGDIVINTPTLTLADQARITATATATATPAGGGGSITLNASQINLSGLGGVFAETQGQAPAGKLNLHPYDNQSTLHLNFAPQSQLSASTTGSGNGGDVTISAPHGIILSGAGKLAVETRGSGQAGNITIAAPQITLSDSVELSASSTNSGQAGNLNLNATTLSLSQGARITSNAAGSGLAGNIRLTVNDRLNLSGTGTGLFATTTAGSTGDGGNIDISADRVFLQDGATITVNSEGSGVGGNVTLQGASLLLNNNASITALTTSGNGGNLNLSLSNILSLRHFSQLNVQAGGAGNGGNISITAPIIFGVGNSDIITNTVQGQGGNINITAQGIIGLLFRNTPTPRQDPTNDITASSQFNVDGSITLNVDPYHGWVELPLLVLDPNQQVAQECQNNRGSTFVITGRGGISESPNQNLSHYLLWTDLRDTAPSAPMSAQVTQQGPLVSTPHPPITATHWRHNPLTGAVELLADNLTPESPSPEATCAPSAVFSSAPRRL